MTSEASLFEQLCQELQQREPVLGISIADVIDLPVPLNSTLRRMLRGRTMSVVDLATDVGLTVIEAGRVAALLVEKGLVTTLTPEGGGEPTYRVRLVHIRQRQTATEAPPSESE